YIRFFTAVSLLLPTAFSLGGQFDSGKAREVFAKSLVLRTHKIIVDTSILFTGEIGQTSSVGYKPRESLRCEFDFPHEDLCKRKWPNLELPAGHLPSNPLPFTLNLRGVPNASCQLVCNIYEGETKIATLHKPLVLVQGIDVVSAQLEDRLERLEGHDST